MLQKTLETKNSSIVYKMLGSGNPVVLLHGFGEDGRIWDSVLESLSSNHTLIVPDLPGSGRSVMKKQSWSIDDFADCIEAILDQEGIQAVSMIGHSMGGYVALAFAERHPTSLKGLGLFHSSAFADSEEKKVTRRKGIQFIEDHGDIKFLEQATPSLFSEVTKSENPQAVKEFIAKFTNFQSGALVHYYEAMMQRPDRTPILKSHPGPVLFIMGESDTAVPLKDGLKQCHMPRLSFIHILRNSGHLGMVEETDKSRDILQNFLQDL